MRRLFILFIAFCIIFFSCELIKLTEKTRKEIKPDPQNSIGVVFLFIQEARKNNYPGVEKLFIFEDSILTIEKMLELRVNVEMFARQIDNREITLFRVDTLNSKEHIVYLEFDYLYEYLFVTQKKNDLWLIRSFSQKK